MQLIQTPSRGLFCDIIFAIYTSIVALVCNILFNKVFIDNPFENGINEFDFLPLLAAPLYTLLFTLLFSVTSIIYNVIRNKPMGLRFIIGHHGIHYGEYDEMITVPWQTFVGMQIQGTGPFQRVIIFALNQEKPLVVKLKAFNSAQREEFKLILKQKIRFYHPLLNNRYIPELS
ncbi:hypothetical protein [Shewanella surugensis]|uniref:PH domain-containing protein n=1 Tax=Shewanella surugensis TaxID=212020 RepID=A0ABT0LFT1_9GAMM|nr:hypothetical protein [Shewanella surugensis]MCL1126523.1 hypothetical protein [Shewanella surugensis]